MKITDKEIDALIQALVQNEGSDCNVSFVLTNSEDENDWISMKLKGVGTITDVTAKHSNHIILFLEEG